MKTIKLTSDEWTMIRKRLLEEYHWKPSVFAIREVMKRELGFVTRYHREWCPEDGPAGSYDGHGEYVEQIHLDFYDDNMETLFRLKYLNV